MLEWGHFIITFVGISEVCDQSVDRVSRVNISFNVPVILQIHCLFYQLALSDFSLCTPPRFI